MPAVEGTRIAGEPGPQAPCERPAACPRPQVGVIGEQRPCQNGPRARLCQGGPAGDEVGAIPLVPEARGPLAAAHHDVVESVWSIPASLAGHGRKLSP